jgi:hypothetical protein
MRRTDTVLGRPARRVVRRQSKLSFIRGIEEAKRVLELHRGTRPRGASVDFTRRVVSALEASLD